MASGGISNRSRRSGKPSPLGAAQTETESLMLALLNDFDVSCMTGIAAAGVMAIMEVNPYWFQNAAIPLS